MWAPRTCQMCSPSSHQGVGTSASLTPTATSWQWADPPVVQVQARVGEGRPQGPERSVLALRAAAAWSEENTGSGPYKLSSRSGPPALLSRVARPP